MTGWAWDYIAEEMTLPRVLALDSYWSRHPPVHEMKAAQLGLGKKSISDPKGFLNEARGSGIQGTRGGSRIPADIKKMIQRSQQENAG